MCNKVNTQEFMLIMRSRFCIPCTILFTHSLWNSDSMILINMLTILESFYRMFEEARGCTLTKRNLVCSMITVSENATPMTLIQGNGASVQLREGRVPGFFIPKTVVICDTSMISANGGVLLKETFSS